MQIPIGTHGPCRRCTVRAKNGAGPCPYHDGSKKKPNGGGTRPAKKAAAVPREPLAVKGARTLLLQKLDEQIADTKAELRALERLKATAGA